MSYVILGFALVCVWHLVYETVLAPLFRFEARAEIAEIRHELEQVKKRHGNQITDRQYRLFREGAVNMDHLVYWMNVMVLPRFRRRFHNDPEFRRNIEARLHEVESVKVDELKVIDRRLDAIAYTALRINSAGWLIFVIPIAVFSSLIGWIHSGIERFIRRILSTPEVEVEKLVPRPCKV